jgi:hypothetical protein
MDEIVSDLVEIFDVEPEELRKDTAGFMNELKEKGYIYEE